MALETDEARQAAARKRLQARMERNRTRQTEHADAAARPAAAEARPKAPSRPNAGAPTRKTSPTALAAAAVVVVLVALLAVALSQCGSSGLFAGVAADSGSRREDLEITFDREDPAQAHLVGLIGEDEAVKLLTAASANPAALWIAAHPDELAIDGDEVQVKLLKLAADEPAAIGFVRTFPAKYPMDEPEGGEGALGLRSPSDEVPNTQVPHLYQWDARWGYTTYSSAAFGLTGCGPTSMSMVAQALLDEDDIPLVEGDEGDEDEDGAAEDTGYGDEATDEEGEVDETAEPEKFDISPYGMAQAAQRLGMMTEFEGTGREFFTEVADQLGLYCEKLYPTGDSVKRALSNGAVVVANLGPGQFTDDGHYFVLAGLSGDGRVIVNDPYSIARSSRTWDADTIADESLALFAYTKGHVRPL